MSVLVGTAGWSLPTKEQVHFLNEGSHLERYARKFPVVEINSTFHRSHRPSSYLRWGESVPSEFRFSVKVPKAITHEHRLRRSSTLFHAFMTEIRALGDKVGCLLVQLPPSLTLDEKTAAKFFEMVRSATSAPVVCEPRNASWFSVTAEKLLRQYQISRVAADPASVPAAAECGAWKGLLYYRLHGSPRPYYSEYPASFLTELSTRLALAAKRRPVWCIFDNTTLGAATFNARVLLDLLRSAPNSTINESHPSLRLPGK